MYMTIAIILFCVMSILLIALAVFVGMLLKGKFHNGKPKRVESKTFKSTKDSSYKVDEKVLTDIRETYEMTNSIEQMFRTLGDSYTGEIKERFQQAIDHMSNSRYKDYETAFSYISDGSAGFAACQDEIIRRELSWRNGLPEKN